MFADTLQLTYESNPYDVTRITFGQNSSEFRGTFGQDSLRSKLKISHTLPKDSHSTEPESHYVEVMLDEDNLGTGDHERTVRAWLVIKTQDGTQSANKAEQVAQALVGFCTPTNIQKLVLGES